MKRAVPTDWQTVELPNEYETFYLGKIVSSDEYEKIQLGLIPLEMEDKWFIYTDDSKLFFHRSWTGNCIYVVTIENSKNATSLTEVKVNRDKSQYKETNVQEDKKLLDYMIDRLLLSKNVPFPTDSKSIPESRNVIKHNIVGYGRSNNEGYE